jgi:hypothetical protein
MVWKFVNGGFVDVPDEVPPEPLPVVEGSGGPLPVPAGANPPSTDYQAALDAYFANPEGGFNYTPPKSTDDLYSAATAQPDKPLTNAVVNPVVAPQLAQPPAPDDQKLPQDQPVVQPQPTPAPTPSAPVAPAPQAAPADVGAQLQGLLQPSQDQSPVENQDLGLTGQLNDNSNPPPVQAPQGLLTGATVTPSVPISGNNLDMSQFSPDQFVQPKPEPAPQPSLINEVVQQGRQALSGALSNATSTPVNLLAALSALVAVPAKKLGYDAPAEITGRLAGEANRLREASDFATGASAQPATPGQTLARTIGTHASPSALMTGAMTLGDLASQALTPTPAEAKPSMTKEQANALLFPQQKPLTPSVVRVTHTMPTAGGPAQVSDGDLSVLGLMGVMTIGAMFAPSVVSRINKTVLPKFNLNAPRSVKNAAPGTEAISNRVDLARTYDDVDAGLFRVARRAGVDPLALERTQDLFHIQTGGASRNLINSAVLNGEMQTPTFTFKVPTPISQLALQDSKPFRDYLHASDTIDDIVQKEARIQNKGPQAVAAQAAIGPVTVRGMSIPDALAITNAIRQTNPEVVALAKAYRENVKEMRRFQGTGQYATLSKQEWTRLNRESQNFVPWRDESGAVRVLGDGAPERLPPFDALKEEMQQSMRVRMENEARGSYIDNMRKVMPNSFVKITPQEFRDNPHWEKQVVTIYRRGKLERYTTDPFLADVLNHDPYAVSGTIAQGLYASKRLMESTATGVLAPWFASTSALRSWQIAKITTPEGLKPPTLIGMTRALPEQVIPQVARAISQSLDNGGWLPTVLGPSASQALSQRLAATYQNSFYALMERSGTHQGSFLQHQRDFNNVLDKMIGQTSGTAKSFFTGYKQFLNAIHNSPSFDFAMKNYNAKNPPQLAFEARHLTGDPQTAGQFLVDGKRAIRMEKPLLGSDTLGKAATLGTQGYGFATGVGREAIPWWNITTQGAKRIGQAYVENPQKFVMKTWTYQAIPAASLWLYTRGAGNDPTGKSYSDYQMRGRSEYNKLMNWYIPIPGRPAEDGFEIPRFHELAPFAHMMEVGLDHVARSSSYQASEDFMRAAFSMIGLPDTFPKTNGGALFSPGEDLKTLGNTFMDVAVAPPTPPLANAVMASQGMVMPQGIFGGEAYSKKQDPYDQLGGMNAQFELMARALGTGLADVIGSGYAAYTQTPEGVAKGLQNAMTEGSKRMIMKTPIARDIFNVKPPMSGNTDITSQLFAKEKVINNLSRYYRTWTRDGGNISTKMASERGGLVVEKLLGTGPSGQSAGLDQPPPTNPLYVAFMDEVYNKFNKDSPDKKVNPRTGNKSSAKDAVWVPDEEGGIGAKSMWRRYGDYSTQLKRLRSINDGNAVTWQLSLSQRPEQLKYLKENNVDYQNPRAVRNFYEQKRQEVAKQILFTIRAVEEDFSKRIGKPFKIEDLDPYAKGPQAGQELAPQPVIPPWYDGGSAQTPTP